MLEDVRHASVIRGVSLETNGEDVVRVFSRNVEILGSRLVMLELERCQLQLGDLLHALESKAMKLLPNTRETRQICDGGIPTTPRAR
jgi:thiazole synthase ThiGH ThiG subunit